MKLKKGNWTVVLENTNHIAAFKQSGFVEVKETTAKPETAKPETSKAETKKK